MTPLESKYIYLRTEYTKSRNFYDFCQYSNFKRLWKKKKKNSRYLPVFLFDISMYAWWTLREIFTHFRVAKTISSAHDKIRFILYCINNNAEVRLTVCNLANSKPLYRIKRACRTQYFMLRYFVSSSFYSSPFPPPLPSRNCVEAGPGENAAAFNPRTKSSMEKKKKP